MVSPLSLSSCSEQNSFRACHDIPSRDMDALESAPTVQVNANIYFAKIEQIKGYGTKTANVLSAPRMQSSQLWNYAALLKLCVINEAKTMLPLPLKSMCNHAALAKPMALVEL